VHELRDAPQARDPLVRWYQHAFKTGSREQAEALFERDVSRFLVFGQIEDYLDRLNNSVSRTTRRALSFIHYKIRTRDRLDRLLEQSFTAFETAGAVGVALEWPLARGPLFSEGSLRDPKVAPSPVRRTPVRNPTMSKEMRIHNELRKQVAKNREVSARELIRYIEAHVLPGQTRNSDTLPIDGVQGLCIHAALIRLTLASEVTPVTRHKNLPFLNELLKRGITLHRIVGEFTDNRWFKAPMFQLRR
jgi:hypothetical protein